jgi:hypothetical protein
LVRWIVGDDNEFWLKEYDNLSSARDRLPADGSEWL